MPPKLPPAFNNEWRRWIAESIMLEQNRDSILATLISAGFEESGAVAEIELAAASPYLRGSRRLVNRLKKYEWLLNIPHRLESLRASAGSIDVRHRLSQVEFFHDYYSANRPVIIQGMIEDWPAIQKWSPSYLKKQFGDRIVEIQINRQSNKRYEMQRDKHRRQMYMAEYVDLVLNTERTNDYYMTASNWSVNNSSLIELWQDIVQIPEYLDGSQHERGFFWFGPAGTITPLHHDLTNNFMAQVYGRKLVKLIPSHDTFYVYNNLHCYSAVDCGAKYYHQHPRFQEAHIIHCEIGPGDLLFLPVGWWHYVKGLSISMTFTFTNFLFDNDFTSSYSTYGEI